MDIDTITQQMKALRKKASKAREESAHVLARTFARGAARLSRRLRRAAAKVKDAGKKAEASQQ